MRALEKPLPFTREGTKELELEIALLEHCRKQIDDECRAAPDNVRESLQRELAAVDDQVSRLREVLIHGEIVQNTGLTVAVGSEVTVEAEYGKPTFTIVGPVAATPRRGAISYESPLGKALLGAALGDWVEVPWEDGHRRLRIVAISTPALENQLHR
ncbi:MAG TPA: GreA/GreB family elongation factor [Chloroflexota bacterium]|nr:GreA/GreB family elongation factor [Chloroflexota bacterium]